MARIVVAGSSETARNQLSGLLASSGFNVFRCCASGSELRRTLNEFEDGIVIYVTSLQDCRIEELYWDYGEKIQILFIAKPLILDDCEIPEIFRLTLPASGQAVIGAVEMLSQLHRMRLPRRAGKEKQVVEQAKGILMKQRHITEQEAHRILQQYAMNHGIKMVDYAMRIISENTEE